MCKVKRLQVKYRRISETKELHPAYMSDFSEIKDLQIQHEYWIPSVNSISSGRLDYKLNYGNSSIAMEIKVHDGSYYIGGHLTQLLCYAYRDPQYNTLLLATQNSITVIFVDENKKILNTLRPTFIANSHVAPHKYGKIHFTAISDFVYYTFNINNVFSMQTMFDFIRKHYEQYIRIND